MARLDYDEITSNYDRRFAIPGRDQVGSALLALASEVGAQCILEVGCGTGHWLNILQDAVRSTYGVDRSLGMLRKARDRRRTISLLRADANALPFLARSFDLVFCVSALHHFDDPEAFVRASARILRPGGALTIIGLNPHAGRDRWYLYEYFPGTCEADLRRYPSSGTVTDWMIGAGYDRVESRIAARILDTRVGEAVFDDPMLQKDATSQLAVLNDEAYAAGIARIRTAIKESSARGGAAVFPVELSLAMVTGHTNPLSNKPLQPALG